MSPDSLRSRPDPLHAQPDPTLGTVPRQLLAGMRAALDGFALLLRYNDVLLWALLGLFVYSLVWAGLLTVAGTYADDVAARLAGQAGPAWWEVALWHVTRVAAYVLTWLVAIALAFLLAMPVASPVFSLLADRAEARFYGDQGVPMPPIRVIVAEIVRGLGRTLVLAAAQITGGMLLWLLSLVVGLLLPPLGTLVGLVGGGAWNAMWIAAMAMGFALENNRVGLSVQVGLLRRHTALLIGFGLVGVVLAWLPLGVPPLVVAGTVLACRLHDHGRLRLEARAAWQSGASTLRS